MSTKTITRNTAWKNDFTLFTTDVKISKNSAKVRNAAAGALIRESTELTNQIDKEGLLNEALSHLNVATTIHPNYKNAHLLTGNAHTYLRDYPEAISSYDRVLDLSPGDSDATQNLVLALREGARKAGSEEKDYAIAIQYLERAIQMVPTDHESISLLGIAHGSNENHREAIKYFQKGNRIETRTSLGITFT